MFAMKLAALALLLVALQDKNEAEELFKKMEEKVVKSKSVQAKLAGEVEAAKFKLSGMVYLDEGSRFRMEVQGNSDGVLKSATVISNGKKVYLKSSDDQWPKRFDAPETFSKLMRTSFARAGFLSAFEFSDSESLAKTDPATAYTVSGFKLGVKEKVGKVEAQVITYTVTRNKRDAAVTLWIDPATLLPLKRLLEMGGTSLSESYSEVKIDEKIDASKFEVPKEEK